MDTFNGQILVDKLAKLNTTQQSIETLSHWCIFHRNKAKHVVETWERQFHRSPREQRVSFLYLANDILQNSRRKGLEFVAEFWKVLPDALNDVFENGDEFGRKAVLRLVDIWDERKVFGSRGQVLKDELSRRNLGNKNRNGRSTTYKSKQGTGDMLEKLISSYENVYGGPVDEDALFEKCQTAINCVEKVEKKVGGELDLGDLAGSGVLEELQGQHGILRECIEQLKVVESSRATLMSNLKEAILEQEIKIEQVHNQLQGIEEGESEMRYFIYGKLNMLKEFYKMAAQSRYDQVGNICEQLLVNKASSEPRLKDSSVFRDLPANSVPEAQAGSGGREAVAPIIYSQQGPLIDNYQHTEEDHRKTAAAAVAAKLAASSSSAEMLSYVLSSLASEGVIGQMAKEDYPSDNKRPKVEDGMAPYIPPQPQPPHPPFLLPDSLHQPPPPQPSSSPVSQPSPSIQPPQPPPPTSSIPPTTTLFMQAAGPMTVVPYNYGFVPLQRPSPVSSYPMGMPPYPGPSNAYPNFQAAPPSISRQ